MSGTVLAQSGTLTAPVRVVVVAVSLAIVGLSYGAGWFLGKAPARWSEHRLVRVGHHSMSAVLMVLIVSGINLAIVAAVEPSGDGGG